jgi:alkaline phosphatase
MKAKKLAIAISILVLALLVSFANTAYTQQEKPGAKHIILIVGDGMNIEHEIVTSRYLCGKDFELSFHKLPYRADVATWDVSTYKYWSGGTYDPGAIVPTLGYDPKKGGDKPYPLGQELPGADVYLKAKATDSASAATAWATGYKTDEGNLAWLPGDPAGGALKTIAELLREKKGYAIGVVSTVPFTHATPAAHVSHNTSRYNYHAIAEEILTRVMPEVVIGGGHPSLEGYGYISPTLYSSFAGGTYAEQYVFVERQAGMDGGMSVLAAAKEAVANGKKLFALYGGPGGSFESPEAKDLPGTPLVTRPIRENPTFAEGTLAALEVLSRDPNGFFLMAEQGDIDWANHDNDFRRMVGTIKDLHDGVQAVVDFVNQPGDDIAWNNTLLMVTSDHGNGYMRNKVKLGAGDLPAQRAFAGLCPPDIYCGAFFYPDGEVTYGTGNHTNELVRLYALGAGITKFSKYEGKWYPGTLILDNTQLFHMMMEAAGQPVPSPLGLAP